MPLNLPASFSFFLLRWRRFLQNPTLGKEAMKDVKITRLIGLGWANTHSNIIKWARAIDTFAKADIETNKLLQLE